VTVSREDARALAADLVASLGAQVDLEFIIVDEIEIGEGWVFFYNDKEYVETGDISLALAGNGPIFIDREGRVNKLSTAEPWEVSVKRPSV